MKAASFATTTQYESAPSTGAHVNTGSRGFVLPLAGVR